MSLAVLVLANSFLICILVGFTEKSISQSLIANASSVRIPPLAKRRRYAFRRLLLQFKRIFRISLTSIGSSSSRYVLGILTLCLNFEGMISISQYAKYDLMLAM